MFLMSTNINFAYDLHSTIDQILFYKLNALKTTKSVTFKIELNLTDDNVLLKLNYLSK